LEDLKIRSAKKGLIDSGFDPSGNDSGVLWRVQTKPRAPIDTAVPAHAKVGQSVKNAKCRD